VLQFEVDDEYTLQFDVKVVGNNKHQELWIPSEDLDKFNNNIVGKIKVVKIYYEVNYIGQKIK